MTAKDSRHAEKASRGKESAMVEMWNAKNVYLLSIEVSNRMLHKYFEKDLPQIHDVRSPFASSHQHEIMLM